MVETTSQLKQIIERYRQELERIGIHCQQILVFGSRAKGTSEAGSDIDLLVISPDWAPYNERERLEILGLTAARILEPIQACGLTAEEIADRRLSPFWQYLFDEEAFVAV